MTTNLLRFTRVLLFAAMTLAACEGEPSPSDPLDAEASELPDGVRYAVVDGVDSWQLSGLEAHEWFRDHLIDRARAESSGDAEQTWELIELIESDLDELASEPAEVSAEEFRAQSVSVSVLPLSVGSERGWTASASASKSAFPGNLDVQTKAKVGNMVVENNQSTWATGTISKSSSAKSISPPNCYARAYARAAGTTSVQEVFHCP